MRRFNQWVACWLLVLFPVSLFASGIDEHGSGGGAATVTTAAPVSGDGSAGTPVTIANGAITLPKLATQADQTVLGNASGGVASPAALSLAGLLSASGGVLATSISTQRLAGRTTAGSGVLESLAVSGGLSLATAGTLTTNTGTSTVIGRTTAGSGAFESLNVSGGLSLATAGTLTTSLNTGKLWARTTAGTGAIEEITPNSTNFSLAAGTFAIAAGGVGTNEIANGSVALGDLANLATVSLIGNATGAPATPTAITLGTGLGFSGSSVVTSLNTGKLWGRTTAASGQIEEITPNSTNFSFSGGTIAVASGGISLANMANLASVSLIGNATGAPAVPAALTLISPLVFSGSSVTTSIATARVVGRTTAGSGVVEQLAVSGGLDLGTAGTLTTSTATAKVIGRTTAGTGAYEQLAVSGGLSLATAGTLTTSATTNKLIGRATAGTGVFEEITLGTNLSYTGTTLNAAGGTAAVKSDQFTNSTGSISVQGSSTSVFVVPNVQQFHPSAAKGWLYCSGNGTRLNSYNVSSITNNSTNDNTITWSTNFTSANYAAIPSGVAASGVSEYVSSNTAQSTSQVRFASSDTSGARNCALVAFGDQ